MTTAASTTVAQGTVIESDPAAGAEVDEGSEVALSVSGGPDTVAVPNVVGLTEDRARSTLEHAGFTSVNSRQTDSLEDEGNVVAVDPGRGRAGRPEHADHPPGVHRHHQGARRRPARRRRRPAAS